ncbi:MAG: DUF2851 family protein [Alistipes sp.]|nr:DUF2851 family protein [Alistipes sp.]
MSLEERYLRTLNRLIAGAPSCACSQVVAAMARPGRLALCTQLLFERLERKLSALMEIYRHADENWNQTLFVMFFRTLGDASNREAFIELAQRVRYNPLLHERASLLAAESLLLGASGLLSLYPADEYTRSLASEFAHLSHKYSIEPMQAEAWNLRRINPMNHPVLRLAQAARFFTDNEFVFDECMSCRTCDDACRLFGSEASEYWMTHFTPGREGDGVAKRIGRSKAALLAINLVAPLQFAYGTLTEKESLRERAVELLESTPAEDNRYMRMWEAGGAVAANAFDSQALLQLSTEYCSCGRCESCPVGRTVLGRVEAEWRGE